MIFNIKPT